MDIFEKALKVLKETPEYKDYIKAEEAKKDAWYALMEATDALMKTPAYKDWKKAWEAKKKTPEWPGWKGTPEYKAWKKALVPFDEAEAEARKEVNKALEELRKVGQNE